MLSISVKNKFSLTFKLAIASPKLSPFVLKEQFKTTLISEDKCIYMFLNNYNVIYH